MSVRVAWCPVMLPVTFVLVRAGAAGEAGGALAHGFGGYRHVKFGAVIRGSRGISMGSVADPAPLAEGDCSRVDHLPQPVRF